MAQWLRAPTCDPKVAGSIPGTDHIPINFKNLRTFLNGNGLSYGEGKPSDATHTPLNNFVGVLWRRQSALSQRGRVRPYHPDSRVGPYVPLSG